MLAIWEQGCTRHAIDRALLLFAAACPELPFDRLADRPLGERNAALFGLRQSMFGSKMCAYIDCPACAERMQLELHTEMFVPPAGAADASDEFEAAGFRFRRPTSRDLCAIVPRADEQSAAAQLLERCCVARPEGASPEVLHGLIETIEARLESLDPCADIRLRLVCDNCQHQWAAPFDIAAVLWDEVEARARGLLDVVHALALAYGWSERDILALGESRRTAYLHMVTA
jgi:hypothetical protein